MDLISHFGWSAGVFDIGKDYTCGAMHLYQGAYRVYKIGVYQMKNKLCSRSIYCGRDMVQGPFSVVRWDLCRLTGSY